MPTSIRKQKANVRAAFKSLRKVKLAPQKDLEEIEFETNGRKVWLHLVEKGKNEYYSNIYTAQIFSKAVGERDAFLKIKANNMGDAIKQVEEKLEW